MIPLSVSSEVKEKYLDPELLSRLNQQILAKEQSLVSKDKKAGSLKRQVEALKEGMALKVKQSQAKLEAERIRLYNNAENQYQRNKKLYEAGKHSAHQGSGV